MVGPDASTDPPLAATLLTVSKLVAVSKSHRILPSEVAYARKWPFNAPETTAPGITDTAAAWPGIQPDGTAQVTAGAGVLQTFWPVAKFTAEMPGCAPSRTIRSEIATYAFLPSAACPHSMPPSALPAPSL